MNCLACGKHTGRPLLDLGKQPLANEYKKTADEPEDVYDLAVSQCTECRHVQLTKLVDPDLLFKNYLYVSGTTETYRNYLKWFAGYVVARTPCIENVMDIACNDGSQLDAFKELGIVTHGVDPAVNLAELSSKNHKIFVGYFEDYTDTVEFDAVTAMNVVGHNPDPYNFVKKCSTILKENGKLFIQTSQADMFRNGEFDTIYHEHASFFNIKSMRTLADRAGMILIDVIKTPVHGNSYVFTLVNKPTLEIEEETEIIDYDAWATQCLKFKDNFIKELAGKRVIGYGAAAKGNTLLNFAGLKLEAIIDDNPLKQGLYTPGMRIPIVSREYLTTISPDEGVCFLPLAWNFFEEIKTNIKIVRDNPLDVFIYLGHILNAN